MAIKISRKTYDKEFVEKLEEISGENFHVCMQCGTCTGVCPMTDHTDCSPRKLVLMSHLGLRDEVCGANNAWVCATCNSCTVRCPRGIELPRLMEAIRQLTLRENINFIEPSDLPEEMLDELPQIALVGCFRKHTS